MHITITAKIFILDVPNGFDVWGLEGLSSDETGELREVTVATNETVGIYCGASLRYSDSVVWLGANFNAEGNLHKKETIKYCNYHSLQYSLKTLHPNIRTNQNW